MELGNWIVR